MRKPPRPLDQDDPFELDLRSAFDSPRPPNTAPPAEPAPQDAVTRPAGGGFFGEDRAADPAGDWTPDANPFAAAFTREPPVAAPEPATKPPAQPDPLPQGAPESAAQPDPGRSAPPPTRPPATADAAALRDALYRGMGLDPAQVPAADPVAEAEQIGARLRDLVEGLTLLLRTRAQEKQKVRVAQTLISSADVNPLKFVANTDEALMSLVVARGQGYLAPQAAVHEAYRDLIDHQVRTWAALQSALRRMIDRFEPTELEREISEAGLLETLIAGGRSAKLWQLYGRALQRDRALGRRTVSWRSGPRFPRSLRR